MKDAQTVYWQDVLGIDLSLRPAVMEDASVEKTVANVIVCVPRLSEAERTLVTKILQSIHLSEVTFQEVEALTPESAAQLPARHILSFLEVDGFKSPDTMELDGKTWWRFFPAPWMLSENEQQNSSRKKQVWTLLQKLKGQLGA